ncbi:MAG: hypothetical protein D6694_02905 [Gammaproteobacteria bacterium]|nr:MAG: hypothetical protein D6694_02905 [Gammaproteobacteria bacterium]
MKRHPSLKAGITSLFAVQALNYLYPLLLVPYLVRVLGGEGFGLLAFAQAMVHYFYLLTDYGFNLSSSRTIAACRDDLVTLEEVFRATLWAKIVLVGLATPVFLAIVFLLPPFSNHVALFLFSFLGVVGQALYPAWFFQGTEKFHLLAWTQLAAKGFVLCALVAWVRSEDDLLLATLLQSLGMLVLGASGLFLAWRAASISLGFPGIRSIHAVLRDGWPLFLSTAGKSLYTNSNVFVLGLLTPPQAVGYFSAADKLVRAVCGLFSPVAQAVYPRINAMLAESRQMAADFIRVLFFRFAGVALCVSLLLFFSADLTVQLLFGTDFQRSAELVRVLAPLPLIIALSNVFGMQVMLPFGLTQQFSRILLAAGVCNLSLVVPLILWQGDLGAVLGVLVTETLISVMMFLVLRRNGLNFFTFGTARFT